MKKASSTVAGILYFFMAVLIVALLMPTVKESISIGLNSTMGSATPVMLGMIITYWPMFFIIFALIILAVLLKP